MPAPTVAPLVTQVSSAACVSQQAQTLAILKSGSVLSPGQTLIGSTLYNVSPSNPYFRIFGVGATITGTPNNACFSTNFRFTNGGSFQSEYTLYWGDEAALDLYVPQMTVMLQPGPADICYCQDPVSNTCPYALPGSVANGVVIRWTALADQVTVQTNLVNTVSTTITSSGTIAHGLLQQIF